jgi:H+/Cl- antiporter ClcA
MSMLNRWDYREHAWRATFFLKWIAISSPVGITVGSAVAFFLWSLDRMTQLHWQYAGLLYLLPVAGLVSGWMYHWLGRESERGNNLLIDEIRQPGKGVPWQMAPLVLVGTLITHLCGGSAGREGTAVQMGGSLAGVWGRVCRLNRADTRLLLMSGMAAGFGAVFGTPVAGTVFALEVLIRGRINYLGVAPCLMASIIADQVTTAWGITHTHYRLSYPESTIEGGQNVFWPDGLLLGKVAIAAVCFGLASLLFAEMTHAVSRLFKRVIPVPWLRPAIGGLAVILMVVFLGQRDYLGLGVDAPSDRTGVVTIQTCFLVGGATWLSWWWKTLFTAVTVGSGFKGGEVTPLFFIGAALGNQLGVMLDAPVDLLAALGFVAVFAGATNTPLASTLMAVELFAPHSPGLLGSGFVVYAALACFIAYFISGPTTIYRSQQRDGESVAVDDDLL